MTDTKRPVVYVGMTADILHHGHINIIRRAAEYGDVMVGLLSDAAIVRYKRLPYLNYDQRKQVLEQLKDVAVVVPQEEWDYAPNLRQYKPAFMIHGDDWKDGYQRKYRERAYAAMQEWKGTIIEVPYTSGISSSALENEMRRIYTAPQLRLNALQRLLESKQLVRVLQVHDPLSASIADRLEIENADGIRRFDAMWSSSLADSLIRFKPDSESIDISVRISAINAIFDVTSKPLILDFDTGGHIEHMHYTINTMERMGISAIVIEDKVGFKRNSLLGPQPNQQQESIANFCARINEAARCRNSSSFQIIARIESLVLDTGMDDAVQRARAYLDAGADGIFIHSRKKTPDEIFKFADHYTTFRDQASLTVVPTSYNSVHEKTLHDCGVNIVIYANHMVRSCYPAMLNCATSILQHERALEADEYCLSIKDMLELVNS